MLIKLDLICSVNALKSHHLLALMERKANGLDKTVMVTHLLIYIYIYIYYVVVKPRCVFASCQSFR